jgi:hypothetical protein
MSDLLVLLLAALFFLVSLGIVRGFNGLMK